MASEATSAPGGRVRRTRRAMTLAEFLATIERRAAEAEREGATAPVANVYRLVLDQVRAVDGKAAGVAVVPHAPPEEPDLPPAEGEEVFPAPKVRGHDH